MSRLTGQELGAALARHLAWRDAGLPTVSVLQGPAEVARRAVRHWAESQRRPVTEMGDSRLDAMVDAWVEGLACTRDLGQDAAAWLARHLGRPAAEMDALIARKTPVELEAFLEWTLPANNGTACRWLLEQRAGGEPIPPRGLARCLGAALAERGSGGTSEQVVAALRALVPPGSDPVFLVVQGDREPGATAWIEAAASSLARLASADPRLSLVLIVEPAELDAYLRNTPESRAKALIRSGVIPVTKCDEDPPAPSLHAEHAGSAGTRAGLASLQGVGEACAVSADVNIGAGSEPANASSQCDDPARSAAERFLFETLESLPETAGLFELNARLPFPFGPAPWVEVDLASRALRLAIEIDGYYHFQDVEAYRRDRRKDLELQSRGFWVVRVLAEDVVARLEEVLEVIRAAVASRRNRNDGKLGSAP